MALKSNVNGGEIKLSLSNLPWQNRELNHSDVYFLLVKDRALSE
jgi:hypothetical protein